MVVEAPKGANTRQFAASVPVAPEVLQCRCWQHSYSEEQQLPQAKVADALFPIVFEAETESALSLKPIAALAPAFPTAPAPAPAPSLAMSTQ